MPTEAELAWAAGFFDGEGSIQIVRKIRKGYESYELFVRVSQLSDVPLRKFAEWFGGDVYFNDQPIWYWQLSSKKVGTALDQLLPYLVVKRSEANVALRFQSRRRNGKKRDAHADNYDREELQLIRQNRRLNGS